MNKRSGRLEYSGSKYFSSLAGALQVEGSYGLAYDDDADMQT